MTINWILLCSPTMNFSFESAPWFAEMRNAQFSILFEKRPVDAMGSISDCFVRDVSGRNANACNTASLYFCLKHLFCFSFPDY